MLPQGYPEVTFYRNLQSLMPQGFAADFQKWLPMLPFSRGVLYFSEMCQMSCRVGLSEIYSTFIGKNMSLNLVPSEDARVEKKDGSVVGPYKASFAGDTILIKDVKADVEEGDVILRKLPNGKDERSIITTATFFQGLSGIAAHYQLKFRKGGSSEMQKPSQNITIHGAQSVQIGDHNTQNIINSLQALSNQIGSSDATPDEKAEAQSLLSKFLCHPLVISILGAAAGSVIGL